jgi:hypothetical protein
MGTTRSKTATSEASIGTTRAKTATSEASIGTTRVKTATSEASIGTTRAKSATRDASILLHTCPTLHAVAPQNALTRRMQPVPEPQRSWQTDHA